MNKILILAAHPDDEVLGCGGTIVKSIFKGDVVQVTFLGEGSTCRFEDPTTKEASESIQERNDWAVNAISKLGVQKFEFNNLPCGRLDQIPIIEINKIIEKEIDKFRPDVVFTHSESDSNNDHQIVFRSSIMATRPSGNHIVKKLYSYEVLSSSEWGFKKPFQPNFFVSLSDFELEKKCEALECYKTEMRTFPFPRSLEGVRNQAIMRGMQSGVKFAEAFCLIREFD